MDILDVCSELTFHGEKIADFIGEGNLWVNNINIRGANRLARHIICEAVLGTAPGQLTVYGYDGELSGVFAPFSAISTGEAKIVHFIMDERELDAKLTDIQRQITAVQNVIQGRTNTLTEFRKSAGRPVESYQLIVLCMNASQIDGNLRTKLSLLLRKGPACGISFLIIADKDSMTFKTRQGEEKNMPVNRLAGNITVLDPEWDTVSVNDKRSVDYVPYTAEQIIEKCTVFAGAARRASLPTVRFDEIQDMDRMWDHCSSIDDENARGSSINGVEFCVGKYGINDMNIILGDEVNQRHNAVITGAVGQGKSNLISVIIHSLCMRYSPKELNLYLLDFKEGVTFKAFSDIDHEDYLPHVKALGLESDVGFGLAVLHFLYDEYLRRMKVLKQYNVKSMRELRQTYPEIEMARIVVVIDEFQMMFGDDLQQGQEVAEILEKSVRLFRAAGINFILASQTLAGNIALSQKKDSIFSQIPIRIALKNSISEAQQILSLTNTAAASLRYRGESIVNTDYGEITQNKKTIVAFADEAVLGPLRREMWKKARDYTSPPYVFESEKRITLLQSGKSVDVLREKTDIPTAVVGDIISIDSQRVRLPLIHEPGRNIAVIGSTDSTCNQAVGMIQSAAISLAAQHRETPARFLFCDFTGGGLHFDKLYPSFTALMRELGHPAECIEPAGFESALETLLDTPASEESVYVFGIGMDRWEYETDPDFPTDTVLKQFVEKAPSKRMHFIGWWIKASAYLSQVGGFSSDSDAFNSKIFLRIDERTVQSMIGPFARWSAQNNRGLVCDKVEFEKEITFIPYAPVTEEDVQTLRSGNI